MNSGPKDYVIPETNAKGQDWSGVASSGISNVARADKGWVLAVVLIILALALSDYFQAETQYKQFTESITRTMDYLKLVETDRQKASEMQSDQMRRNQELMHDMVNMVARQSERTGRLEHRSGVIGTGEE